MPPPLHRFPHLPAWTMVVEVEGTRMRAGSGILPPPETTVTLVVAVAMTVVTATATASMIVSGSATVALVVLEMVIV